MGIICVMIHGSKCIAFKLTLKPRIFSKSINIQCSSMYISYCMNQPAQDQELSLLAFEREISALSDYFCKVNLTNLENISVLNDDFTNSFQISRWG